MSLEKNIFVSLNFPVSKIRKVTYFSIPFSFHQLLTKQNSETIRWLLFSSQISTHQIPKHKNTNRSKSTTNTHLPTTSDRIEPTLITHIHQLKHTLTQKPSVKIQSLSTMAAAMSFISPPSTTLLLRRNPNRPNFYKPLSIKSYSAPLTQDDLKKLAADKAVEYVKSGMVLGLGTGSTAAFVVSRIGELLKTGELKNIVGIPTSKRTEEQALSLGIPLSILDDHPKLDLAIDGADEVDPNLDLVKGRGGALLREKMVEAASDKFVVVVDDTKLVDGLGGSKLAMPVEVVQFCWKYNLVRLQGLFKENGVEAKLRLNEDGKPYVTDNSNYIVDLYFEKPIKDGPGAGKAISELEGVVEHGLFLNMTTAVIIAGKDGVSVKAK